MSIRLITALTKARADPSISRDDEQETLTRPRRICSLPARR